MTGAELWSAIYPWIASAIGGFIGAALLLPTKLGEAVINYRVGKALETHKAENNRDLARLKEQLDHLSDRGRRSNELEFTSIELVWKAFVKAWLSTNTCIGGMTTIPHFSRMTEDEVKSFASASGLSEGDQKTLLQSNDREREYLTIISWRRVNDAGQDIFDARLALREQCIFMPESVSKEFEDVIESMSGAQVERRLSLQHPNIRSYEFGKAATDWMTNCTAEFKRMAKLVNERLFRDDQNRSDSRGK